MILNKRGNKKGQIGKLISLFPIMFLVFIMMGIFVVLSASFSVKSAVSGGQGSPVFSEQIITQEDLMLRTIPMTFEKRIIDASTGQARDEEFSLDMKVLDAVIIYSNNAYPNGASEEALHVKEVLRGGLKYLIENDEYSKKNVKGWACLFLFKSNDYPASAGRALSDSPELGSYYLQRKGEGIVPGASIHPYAGRGIIRDISFIDKDGKQVYVDYYYGECLI